MTFKHGPTGVFLDPPYADTAGRTANLYAVDCQKVARRRERAIEQGKNPLMRIVLAGTTANTTCRLTGGVHEWQATGGYALSAGEDGVGRENARRERPVDVPGVQSH